MPTAELFAIPLRLLVLDVPRRRLVALSVAGLFAVAVTVGYLAAGPLVDGNLAHP